MIVFDIDFEFHFSHGASLAVSVQNGRDTYNEGDTFIIIAIKGEHPTTMRVFKHKLNAWQTTERTEVIKRQHGDTLLELS